MSNFLNLLYVFLLKKYTLRDSRQFCPKNRACDCICGLPVRAVGKLYIRGEEGLGSGIRSDKNQGHGAFFFPSGYDARPVEVVHPRS